MDQGVLSDTGLVLSYWSIFERHAVDNNKANGEKHAATVDGRTIWYEDTEWTEERRQQAEQRLQENSEKCSSGGRLSKVPDYYAWNTFYESHKTSFFKDRHYLKSEFPDDLAEAIVDIQSGVLIEIGCGVGNTLLPLIEKASEGNQAFETFHGLDLSSVAIDFMKDDSRFKAYNKSCAGKESGAFGHVCDITTSLVPECRDVAHVATLFFCLSAIDPTDMSQAFRNACAMVRPRGFLLFRDYGRYDDAQMKLGTSRGKQLGPNFYQKHDGTKCFYFSKHDVEQLAQEAGMTTLSLEYVRRVYLNHGSMEKRRRVWIQGRFQKPEET